MKVGVVCSAYGPDESLVDVVRPLADDLGTGVVVVDDGSGRGFDEVWTGLRDAGARVVHLPRNGGIAAALNAGIRLLLEEGFDAIVTIDQDSEPDLELLRRLQDEYRDAANRGVAVGLVVPERFAGVSQVHRVRAGTRYTRHSIQSGMLIPRSTFDALGLLREDLFIDLVDTEFELRCARAGLAAIAAPGTELGHELGRKYLRRALGRPVRLPGIPQEVTLSSPFRYYYRVRNRRVINSEYARDQFAWIARDSLLELLHYANALMLATPRRELWKIYVRAWRDGGSGRMGPMPDDLRGRAAVITWNAPELGTSG